MTLDFGRRVAYLLKACFYLVVMHLFAHTQHTTQHNVHTQICRYNKIYYPFSIWGNMVQDQYPATTGGFTLTFNGSVSPSLHYGVPVEDIERAIASVGKPGSVTASSNTSGGFNYTITVSKYVILSFMESAGLEQDPTGWCIAPCSLLRKPCIVLRARSIWSSTLTALRPFSKQWASEAKFFLCMLRTSWCRAAEGKGLIAVNSSGLIAGGRNANAMSSVMLLQEAGSQIFFHSIPREMLSVPSKSSQVWPQLQWRCQVSKRTCCLYHSIICRAHPPHGKLGC